MATAGPLKWFMNFFAPPDTEEEEMEESPPPDPEPSMPLKRPRSPLTLRTEGEGGIEIHHPRTLDERKAIGMDLKQRRMVTLDLTKMHDAEARYFLEFVYGLVFALDATAEKVSENIYLLAPHGIIVHNDAEGAEAQASATASRSSARATANTTGQEEMFWQAR